MAVQYNTALRTAMGQQLVDSLAGGDLKFFSGSVPANCAAADPATTLATCPLPATAASVTSGVVSKSGTWTFTGQSGAGTGTDATVFRVYNAAAVCVEQGTVTVTGGGGDLTLDNANIADTQVGAIGPYTRTMPGA